MRWWTHLPVLTSALLNLCLFAAAQWQPVPYFYNHMESLHKIPTKNLMTYISDPSIESCENPPKLKITADALVPPTSLIAPPVRVIGSSAIAVYSNNKNGKCENNSCTVPMFVETLADIGFSKEEHQVSALFLTYEPKVDCPLSYSAFILAPDATVAPEPVKLLRLDPNQPPGVLTGSREVVEPCAVLDAVDALLKRLPKKDRTGEDAFGTLKLQLYAILPKNCSTARHIDTANYHVTRPLFPKEHFRVKVSEGFLFTAANSMCFNANGVPGACKFNDFNIHPVSDAPNAISFRRSYLVTKDSQLRCTSRNANDEPELPKDKVSGRPLDPQDYKVMILGYAQLPSVSRVEVARYMSLVYTPEVPRLALPHTSRNKFFLTLKQSTKNTACLTATQQFRDLGFYQWKQKKDEIVGSDLTFCVSLDDIDYAKGHATDISFQFSIKLGTVTKHLKKRFNWNQDDNKVYHRCVTVLACETLDLIRHLHRDLEKNDPNRFKKRTVALEKHHFEVALYSYGLSLTSHLPLFVHSSPVTLEIVKGSKAQVSGKHSGVLRFKTSAEKVFEYDRCEMLSVSAKPPRTVPLQEQPPNGASSNSSDKSKQHPPQGKTVSKKSSTVLLQQQALNSASSSPSDKSSQKQQQHKASNGKATLVPPIETGTTSSDPGKTFKTALANLENKCALQVGISSVKECTKAIEHLMSIRKNEQQRSEETVKKLKDKVAQLQKLNNNQKETIDSLQKELDGCKTEKQAQSTLVQSAAGCTKELEETKKREALAVKQQNASAAEVTALKETAKAANANLSQCKQEEKSCRTNEQNLQSQLNEEKARVSTQKKKLQEQRGIAEQLRAALSQSKNNTESCKQEQLALKEQHRQNMKRAALAAKDECDKTIAARVRQTRKRFERRPSTFSGHTSGSTAEKTATDCKLELQEIKEKYRKTSGDLIENQDKLKVTEAALNAKLSNSIKAQASCETKFNTLKKDSDEAQQTIQELKKDLSDCKTAHPPQQNVVHAMPQQLKKRDVSPQAELTQCKDALSAAQRKVEEQEKATKKQEAHLQELEDANTKLKSELSDSTNATENCTQREQDLKAASADAKEECAHKIEDLKREFAQLKHSEEICKNMETQLKSELQQATNAQKSCEKNFNRVKKVSNEAQQAIQALQEDFSNYKTACLQQQNVAAATSQQSKQPDVLQQVELEQCKAALTASKKQVKEQKKTAEEQEAQLQNLEDANSMLKHQLSESTRGIENLKQREKELESGAAAAKEECTHKIEGLKHQVDELKDSEKNYKNMENQLKGKLDQATNAQESCQKDLKKVSDDAQQVIQGLQDDLSDCKTAHTQQQNVVHAMPQQLKKRDVSPQAELTQCKDALSAAQRKVEEQEKATKKQEAHLQELEDANTKLKSELSDSTNATENCTQREQDLKAASADAKEECAHKIEDLKREFAQLKHSEEICKNMETQLKSELQQATNAQKSCEKNFNRVKKVSNEAQQAIQALQEDFSNYKTACLQQQNVAAATSQQSKQPDVLQQVELEQCKAALTASKKQVKEQKKTAEEQEAQLQNLEDANSMLKHQLSESTRGIQNLKQREKELEAGAAAAKEECTHKIEGLKHQVDELKDSEKNYKNMENQLKGKLDQATNAQESCQKDLKKASDKLKDQLSEITSDTEGWKQREKDLKAEVADAKAECKDTVEDLTRQLKKLKASEGNHGTKDFGTKVNPQKNSLDGSANGNHNENASTVPVYKTTYAPNDDTLIVHGASKDLPFKPLSQTKGGVTGRSTASPSETAEHASSSTPAVDDTPLPENASKHSSPKALPETEGGVPGRSTASPNETAKHASSSTPSTVDDTPVPENASRDSFPKIFIGKKSGGSDGPSLGKNKGNPEDATHLPDDIYTNSPSTVPINAERTSSSAQSGTTRSGSLVRGKSAPQSRSGDRVPTFGSKVEQPGTATDDAASTAIPSGAGKETEGNANETTTSSTTTSSTTTSASSSTASKIGAACVGAGTCASAAAAAAYYFKNKSSPLDMTDELDDGDDGLQDWSDNVDRQELAEADY